MNVNPSEVADSLRPSDSEADVDTDADVDDVVENQEAAEGSESSGLIGSRDGLQDALLSTDPQKPLEDVESPWNPDDGGMTRIYRGLQKMLGFSGMPAIVDVVVGIGEFVTSYEPDGPNDDVDDGSDDTDEIDFAEGSGV